MTSGSPLARMQASQRNAVDSFLLPSQYMEPRIVYTRGMRFGKPSHDRYPLPRHKIPGREGTTRVRS
jgi:hypothetical protein